MLDRLARASSVISVVAGLMVLPPVSIAMARDDLTVSRFKRDAPMQWQSYIGELGRGVKGKLSYSHFQTGKKLYMKGEAILLFRLPCAFVSHQPIGEFDAAGEARGLNERYAFSLKRDKSVGPWVLVAIGSPANGGKQIVRHRTDQSVLDEIAPQLTAYDLWLPDLVKDSKCEIARAARLQVGDRELVKVDFVYEQTLPRRSLVRSGSITMDPSNYWLLTECSADIAVTGEASQSYVGTFNMKVGEHGLPIIEKYVDTRRRASSPINDSYDTQYELTYDLKRTQIVDSEFSLGQFGIHEPETLRPHSSWPNSLLWIVVALVCMVGFIIVLRHRR